MDITYALEETPLGTAGSVKNAEACSADETFIVISGDALTDIDLAEVIDVPQGEGRRRHDRAQARRRPARVRRRHHRRGRQDRALPREAHVGPGLLGHDQHRHLRRASPRSSTTSRHGSRSTSPASCSRCSWRRATRSTAASWTATGATSAASSSYMQAHATSSTARSACYIPGVRTTRRRVGRGGRRRSTRGARSADKVVIGANAEIKAGAEIGEYTVIGDNCVRRRRTRTCTTPSCGTTRSWATRASLHGSGHLPGRRRPRRTRRVEMGAVIGDETTVGHGRASSATTCRSTRTSASSRPPSSPARSSGRTAPRSSLFGADGVAGHRRRRHHAGARAAAVAGVRRRTLPTGQPRRA